MTPTEQFARVRRITRELKAHSIYLGAGSLPATEVTRVSMVQASLQIELNNLLFELETSGWLGEILAEFKSAQEVAVFVGQGALG